VFSGCKGAFLGLKRPGRDVDYSPPSSAEVNNEWIHTSALLVCLHGVYRETFTFNVKTQTKLGAANYGLHNF